MGSKTPHMCEPQRASCETPELVGCETADHIAAAAPEATPELPEERHGGKGKSSAGGKSRPRQAACAEDAAEDAAEWPDLEPTVAAEWPEPTVAAEWPTVAEEWPANLEPTVAAKWPETRHLSWLAWDARLAASHLRRRPSCLQSFTQQQGWPSDAAKGAALEGRVPVVSPWRSL